MKLPQSVLNKIFAKAYKEDDKFFQDDRVYLRFIVGCLKCSCNYLDQKIKELDTYNIGVMMFMKFLIFKTDIGEDTPQYVISFKSIPLNEDTQIIRFTKDIEYRKYFVKYFHEKFRYIFVDYENNYKESAISNVVTLCLDYIKEYTENNKEVQEIEFNSTCKLSLLNYPIYRLSFPNKIESKYDYVGRIVHTVCGY